MEDDGGALHFFERGAEGGDERVRQMADEADRVRQEHAALGRKLDGADGGVERGEHLGRLEDARLGDGVEGGALAGVGVADERDGGDGRGFASLALRSASFRMTSV